MRIWTIRDADGNVLNSLIGEADDSFIGTEFDGVLIDSVRQEADRGESAARIRDAANDTVIRDIANIVSNFRGSVSTVEAVVNDFKEAMSTIVGNISLVRYSGTGLDKNRIYMTNPITGDSVLWTSTSAGNNSLFLQAPYGGASSSHRTTYVAPDRSYAIVSGVTGNGYATLIYN